MNDTIYVVMVGNNYQKRPERWAETEEEAENWIDNHDDWEHQEPEYQIKEVGQADTS